MPNILWPTNAIIDTILKSNDIHVWCVNLLQPEPVLTKLTSLLNNDERERANRFMFAKHKNAFTVARGVLRLILGKYLQQSPESIEFAYAHYGKPYLPDNKLFFNLSHSNELAVYALCHTEMMGIDIEYVPKPIEHDALVTRFFSQYEIQQFRKLTPEQKQLGFFSGWTRKEAFIKAVGQGLSYPLDEFSVILTPEVEPLLFMSGDAAVPQTEWSLYSLNPAIDYVAAIAIQQSKSNLYCGQWECL